MLIFALSALLISVTIAYVQLQTELTANLLHQTLMMPSIVMPEPISDGSGTFSMYGQTMQIPAVFGNLSQHYTLDTSTTYSQVPRDIATRMGLKGHKKLIGVSHRVDGYVNYNFLTKGAVVVEGMTYRLVLKLEPSNQPMRLGLDFMTASGIVFDFTRMTFSVKPTSFDSLVTGFRFLDLDALMLRAGLTEQDLLPVDQLGDASVAYAQALAAGDDKLCVYLGVSSVTGRSGGPVWAGHSL